MRLVYPLRDLAAYQPKACGNKGAYLAQALRLGLPVPEGFVLSAKAYRRFVSETGLDAALARLLSGRDLSALRFEEVFDLSLAIRNLFVRAPRAEFLDKALQKGLARLASPGNRLRVMVRSSSLSEDGPHHSFAGLHESLGPLPAAQAYEAVMSVYASLFSDRSLFYRQELGLDPHTSAMAVLVQAFAPGRVSGVAFSVNPARPGEMLVEAAPGAARGVVEGSSDVWTYRLGREDDARPKVVPPARDASSRAPLRRAELLAVTRLARSCEEMLGRAADVEWTLGRTGLILLQTRPAGARAKPSDSARPWEEADKRPWYVSLQKTLPQLEILHQRITERILPDMAGAARELAAVALERLNDQSLAQALDEREQALDQWREVYWRELIPFAHAMRLFGVFYNDAVRPEDPHAFIELLSGPELTAVTRNEALQGLADTLRRSPGLLARADRGDASLFSQPELGPGLAEFQARFGTLACDGLSCFDEREFFLNVLASLAKAPPRPPAKDQQDAGQRAKDFLRALPRDKKALGARLLSLARASRALRDNDNLVLAAVRAELNRALREARRRLERQGRPAPDETPPAEVRKALLDPGRRVAKPVQAAKPEAPPRADAPGARPGIHQGQAASPGLAEGPARIIRRFEDLRLVEPGEVLVVDSLSPEMTFVAPLVAGIVERRGGMLVHGAIIAREYGLPCVTGLADAVGLFADGERLLVDGFSGQVRRADPDERRQDSAPPAK